MPARHVALKFGILGKGKGNEGTSCADYSQGLHRVCYNRDPSFPSSSSKFREILVETLYGRSKVCSETRVLQRRDT